MLFVKKSSEYKQIYNDCKKYKGEFYLLLVKCREDFNGPRLGIVVRKKVGIAVKRNKIKRLVRAYVRSHQANLPDNLSGIVIALDTAGGVDWTDTVNDLNRCFEKAILHS